MKKSTQMAPEYDFTNLGKHETVDKCDLIILHLTWLEKPHSYLTVFIDMHLGTADLFFVEQNFL